MFPRKAQFLKYSGCCFFLVFFLTIFSQGQESPSLTPKEISPVSPKVTVFALKGDIINPVISKFIRNSIEKAFSSGSSCFVIELDTPGGLLDSTREIVKVILNSPLPVIVYVSPQGSRAASAGVFITASAHIAAMAPSTHIGAAHPVAIGSPSTNPSSPETPEKQPGENLPGKSLSPKEQDIMTQKILQDTLAWMDTIAKTRGRNTEWLKKAVEQSSSVTEEEALKLQVIDLISPDLRQLLETVHGKEVTLQGKKTRLNTKNATLERIELSSPEKFLNAIANPNIAYILMTLGMIGLIFEFTHPGVIFPGVAGLICLLMAFFSLNTMPINYTGILLIVFAVILILAEFFAPTFGLLALGGIISFIFGSMMLIDEGYPYLQISMELIIPFALLLGAIVLFISFKVLSLQRSKPVTGKEGLLGEKARVELDLCPEGKIFVHGELWNAVSASGEHLEKGTWVKIQSMEGLCLTVIKL